VGSTERTFAPPWAMPAPAVSIQAGERRVALITPKA